MWHGLAGVNLRVAYMLWPNLELSYLAWCTLILGIISVNNTGSYRLGVALVSASALFWSLAGIFPRLIHADTPTMLLWRGLFGCLLMFAYMAFEARSGIFKRLARMDRYGVLYALIGAFAMQLFIASFRYTSVAHGAVIYAVVPFMAGALGWLLLKEAPSKTAIASSLIALIGVGIMVGTGSGEGHISGDLMALSSTFAMASLMVLVATFMADVYPTGAREAELGESNVPIQEHEETEEDSTIWTQSRVRRRVTRRIGAVHPCRAAWPNPAAASIVKLGPRQWSAGVRHGDKTSWTN